MSSCWAGWHQSSWTSPYCGLLMKEGVVDEAVRVWQITLNHLIMAHGLYNPFPTALYPDGVFGAKTKEITIRFQMHCALDADGIAGPMTQEAMASHYEQYSG